MLDLSWNISDDKIVGEVNRCAWGEVLETNWYVETTVLTVTKTSTVIISKYQISKDVGVTRDQNYLQKIKTGSQFVIYFINPHSINLFIA